MSRYTMARVGWLLVSLHVLFWSPMAWRIARRKTPKVTIGDELTSSFRIPGLVMYFFGNLLVWIGLTVQVWTVGLDPNFTAQVIVGILLHVMGIGLMFWAFTVHTSWNIQPRLEPDHQLCTVGPYGLVRHPIYLAYNLLSLGAVVWVPTPLVILGAALIIIGGDLRARAEERILVQKFGEQYRTYLSRVSRVIPGVY
jgi:protein-S-isoprenylcysteine O-methyltransferase Ste14